MTIITGHFVTQLAAPITSWTALTAVGAHSYIQPSPANGYYYQALTGGTTGGFQPTWPTIVGAVSATDGLVSGWLCKGAIIASELAYWDQEQSQSINGDLGGTWSPTTPITFNTANGGVVLVEGPTQVTNSGVLAITSSATLVLGAGDFPRNGPTHLGRTRRIITSAKAALAPIPIGLRPNLGLGSTDAVACNFVFYAASADDSTCVITTTALPWDLPLHVHNGATLADVVLYYRANLGTPTARVVAISPTGGVTPLTSSAEGADANGYVTAPSPVSTDVVQTWTIPIDGGASSANAVISRDGYSYHLQVVEDPTQTTYPGSVPVLTAAYLATTGPIDLANAPTTIDSVANIAAGQRILVANQFDPDENGVYLYPGAGKTFPVASGTPIKQWVAAHAYSVGDQVVPVGAVPGHGQYFQCTTAGTSSSSTQPNWPLQDGATIGDGGGALVWTCQGPVTPWTYNPVVEIRTYGLQQGSVIQVIEGNTLAGLWFQYTGGSIDATSLGTSPALGWFGIPYGTTGIGGDDVPQDGAGTFAAQGNSYHAAACDFVEILTQEFQ